MKAALFLYRAAALLILLAIVVFYLGYSLAFCFESFYWLEKSYIVVVALVLMAASLPFAFACLISSAASGLIRSEHVFIALIASLFFFVFGYIASVFTLGYTIKREIKDGSPDNQPWPVTEAPDEQKVKCDEKNV